LPAVLAISILLNYLGSCLFNLPVSFSVLLSGYPVNLPNAAHAFIEPRKVTAYLLDVRHPDGGSKAAFFLRFGFDAGQPGTMIAALLAHARSHPVARLQKSKLGTSYVIEGPLQTPDGRNPQVRTVWLIETGEDAPRLLTAIPLKGNRT
jgi:Domain of unknown function (DUF6883)